MLILKLFYDRYINQKVWSGIKTLWTFQCNSTVISSINKLIKGKVAKSLSTFDFSTLYTKIHHDKPLHILNETTDFTLKGWGSRDYVTVYSSGAFWSESKSKAGRSYSLHEIKSCWEFIIGNKYLQIGSKIFRQVVGNPLGSDSASFFVNVFFIL